jgi:hypothetical protein
LSDLGSALPYINSAYAIAALIHSQRSKSWPAHLPQYYVGMVAQIWIGADKLSDQTPVEAMKKW